MKPAALALCRRARRRGAAGPIFVIALALVAAPAAAAGADTERGENRARVEPRGFLYGGAIGARREIYTGYDRRVVPLPVIGYRGENLLVFGPFVNYALFNSGGLGFDIRLSPRFAGFDESDSEIFAGMAERESSMDLGFGITYERDDWKLEFVGLRDALGRSDGREWKTSLGRVLRAGPVFVEPAIGLGYVDRSHVDYYYGVDYTEATASRPAYDGAGALNTRLGITLVTPVYFDGLTRIGIENTWYDSPISDSPLTDIDSSLSVFVAFSKFFDR